MKLLIDYNNLFYRIFYKVLYSEGKTKKIDYVALEKDIKESILNSILLLSSKFKSDKIICAVDTDTNWREGTFDGYKGTRSKTDDIDWKTVLGWLDTHTEIFKGLGIQKLMIDDCEADDIIAIISKHDKENIIIVSNDDDFSQLLVFDNVKLYQPNKQQFKERTDISKNLIYKIILGDRGDGIPNIKNPLDFYVGDYEGRAVGLGVKTLDKKILDINGDIDNDLLNDFIAPFIKRYEQNVQLISFDCIPKHIENKILNEYKRCKFKKSKRLEILRFLKNNNLNDIKFKFMSGKYKFGLL